MSVRRVELVTPVHNRRDITLQCLRSLTAADRTGIELYITVVDDGSTDGTAEAVRSQFPEVQIIVGDGDLWYTAGTNLGVESALTRDPDYIICFNDDSIFEGTTIRALVECAERNPRSVVGALLLLWDRPDQVFQVAPYWKTLRGGWQHRSRLSVNDVPASEFPVEMIVGNCVLYPKEAFDLFGFPDPKISAQYGDAEFTTRIRKRGWNLLIEPRARVLCKPNDPSRSVFSYGFRKAVSLLLVDQRHGNNLPHQFRQLWHTAPSRLAGSAAFFLFYANLLLRKIFWASSSKNDPPLAAIETKDLR